MDAELVDFHDPRRLHTRCEECGALITIRAAAVCVGGTINCWYCHAPAQIWLLIGQDNRGPLDSRIGGTEAA